VMIAVTRAAIPRFCPVLFCDCSIVLKLFVIFHSSLEY
jgi:hypothetical protein